MFTFLSDPSDCPKTAAEKVTAKHVTINLFISYLKSESNIVSFNETRMIIFDQYEIYAKN
ncbi:hypothetical protein D3C81_2244190 [compost metagenome]